MASTPSHHVDDIGMAAFLAELVRARSVNLPGNEGSVAALMTTKLGTLGFETTIVEAVPGRPSVVADIEDELVPSLQDRTHPLLPSEDAHFLLDAGIPTAMYGPYRRTKPNEDPQFTSSGMADESVDLDDVARVVHIYAQLMIDLLGDAA